MRPEAPHRVYVTGASGALGGAAVRHLAGIGLDVVGVSRAAVAEGIVWRRSASMADAGWYDPSEPRAVIVHAAGPSSVLAEAAPDEELALFERLTAAGWRGRLTLLSSAAVYGAAPVPVSEDTQPRPTSAYGRYKLALEDGVRDLSTRHGFDLVTLRLANVYGTALDLSRRRVAALVVDAALGGAPFTLVGNGSSRRDYLHVDDFARAVAATILAHAPLPSPFNIASGTGTSLAELVDLVGRLAGRPVPLVRVPERGEVAASVLDIRRARAALCWSPQVGLEAGLARLIHAMSQSRA